MNYSHGDIHYLQIMLQLEQICVRNFVAQYRSEFPTALLPELSFGEGKMNVILIVITTKQINTNYT